METKVVKPYTRWTPEERSDVLIHIAYGYTIEETAKEIGRSVASVDTELKDMRHFYEAKTLPQMIYIACKLGIIDFND